MEMILFTEGPNMLFLRAKPEEAAIYLQQIGLKRHKNPTQAFLHTLPKDTIVFVTEPDKIKTRIEDAIYTFHAPWGSDITLTYLYNNKQLTQVVEKADLGPGIIFLKGIDNTHVLSLKEKIQSELYSHIFPFVKGVEIGEVEDTIIYTTTDSLSHPVLINLEEEIVLVHKDKYFTTSFLEKNIIRIFMETIEENTLKELGITIYDHYNLYDLQRQRIYTVITDLSLGFIVGERFTTDSPRFLMKVIVYLIKLLTHEDIEKIKWYMMGLEFLENGERICDIDIIKKGRKLSWRDLKGIEHTGRKELVALKAREELISLLSEEARKELQRLDEQIAMKIKSLS